MDNLFSVDNKVIIITGAAGSIGENLSIGLANQNAIVYALDKKLSKTIRKYDSSKIIPLKCDITNYKQVQTIFKKIFRKEKKIDVLINNAGISLASQKKDELYSNNDWIETLNVNLTGSFYCSKESVKYMLKNKMGSIINITSINAELGFPRNPAYNASKGGLKMLTKAFAKDWSKHGIRVNSIGPGYIKTT